MQFEFFTVDVFTRQQFGGNPLAVLPRAEGLSTEEMQAIAREFNLSETTFVLPPENPMHTARVRIFTPAGEMPFAGHPNVGTAFVLARLGSVYGSPVRGDDMIFEETAGLVAMRIERDEDEVLGARLSSPQPLSVLTGGAGTPTTACVARACGLGVADILTDNHAPCIVSCGTRFTIAEVRDRPALRRASPVAEVFRTEHPGDLATGIHLYCRESRDARRLHARMFAPEFNVVEDPATGSANVALAGLLASLDASGATRFEFDVLQGEDMGRPSHMAASAQREANGQIRTAIGGRCVPVMKGTLQLRA